MNIKEFGQNFFGPLLSQYLKSVFEGSNEGHLYYCLAREGHFIQAAISELKKQGLLDTTIDSRYLIVSRVFMFKILLGAPESWQFSLSPKFEGNLQTLLAHRFNLSQTIIDSILSEAEQTTDINLPEDIDTVKAVFLKHHNELSSVVSGAKIAYLAYLEYKGFGVDDIEHNVLDIGYSGTIQKLLTLLTSTSTTGHYFIASKPGTHVVAGNNVQMHGVFKEGVKLGDGHVMLDRSLFLESLLTAPSAQLVDLRINPLAPDNEEKFEFFYGMRANCQKQFYLLQELMSGAIEHVVHCFKYDIEYSNDDLDNLYEQYVSKPNMIPHGVRHLFEIDDAISGNATISYQQLFQL
ncbi:HAD family hydrolase [Thalassotalea eurytherma]|uniref:Uncharacterized protein n=1 Tax=Thalassotalea eurytherma TaxID=1144278 RepID=A0ABQ6GZG4_9GAMM|nr:HAD family hydrolase [Thalassotalea eurytherma]GLX81285.1 hypothetical protein theurythT_07370 [Thalassotalea eurytherma]